MDVLESAAPPGRESLMADVLQALPAAGSFVILEGDPGVGKTTMLAALGARLEAHWSWSARCLEIEAGLGLAVLADFFASVPADVVSALAAQQRRTVDLVLYLDEVGTEGPLPARLLGATTLSLLRMLLERGTILLIVDDLHWCDAGSLAALSFALHRLGGSGWTALASCRSGLVPDVPEPLIVPVPILGTEEIRALVTDIASDARPVDVESVVRSALGNPYFARELARALARGETAQLPDSLRSALGRRLAALPEPARLALLDVAVRGAPSESEIAIDALRPAFLAGVVTIDGAGVLRFVHPLLASVTTALATSPDLADAHRRAATATSDPVSRAWHRARCEPPGEDLATELDAAVTLAGQRGDWVGARTLSELSISMTGDPARAPERTIVLAEFEAGAGNVRRAASLATEAHRSTVDPALRLRATAVIAGTCDDHDDAVELLLAAMAAPGLTQDDLAPQHRTLPMRMWKANRLAEAIDLLAATCPAEDEPGAGWCETTATLALLSRLAGCPIDQRRVDRAVQRERAENDRGVPGAPLDRAAGVAGILAYFDDRHEDARALLAEADANSAVHGKEAMSDHFLGMLACRVGDLEEAVARLTRVLASAVGQGRPDALARLTYPLVWQGADDVARQLLVEADSLLAPGDLRLRAEVRSADGLRQLFAGRPELAWPLLREASTLLDTIGQREPSRTPALPSAIEAAAALGEADVAEELCARLQSESEAVASRWGLACAVRGRAQIAAAGGLDTAATLYLEAADRFDAVHVPLEAARSRLLLGALLRRAGHRRDARRELFAARAGFGAAGAVRLSAAVDIELARIGGRTPTASSALTGSEQQVADLVATGMRNSEVARTLHLSPKTVETHLGRVYRKLGVSNRTELAARPMPLRSVDGDDPS